MAGLEYLYLRQIGSGITDLMDRVSHSGYLPCFCDHEYEAGADKD